ncbi:restriction endonuclease subunit S [Aliarcobacter butzleri]|uniref:restriction endonuclease subunit S n=1 Tax=Aliarcobacter butzleri TaxID=28197 RepID=UPI002874F844|nr:restriction endonuclease subunit S [Aliarcobacter butzleri]MDS1371612.1 restriction endonuclease subunit S [Aliarcobacter butzleri]
MGKLEKYSSYKDSGVEWLGEIPNHWTIKRVKALSRVKRGASPRPIDDPRYFDDNGEFAWVRIADVTANEHYLNTTTQRLSKIGASLSVKLQSNELFLSIAGSVGKPMISNMKCCIHDGFVYFPELKFNKEFLYRVFETGRPYVGLGKTGTQLNLNTESVGSIFIPIPPENEIDAILLFLDEKTAQIDEGISQKEKLIELLKERKQIVINDAVTKGLDKNFEFVDSGVEWIGEIPKHWNVEKGKRLFQQMKRPVRDTDEIVTCFRDGEVTLRTNRRIDGFTNALKEHGYQGIRKGDFVIHNMDAFAGAIGISDSDGKSTPVYSVCRPWNESMVFSEYYAKYLRNLALQDFILSLAKGIRERSTDFRFKDFGELEYPLPPKDEQQQIVEHIETQTTKIDKAIELQQNYISKLKEYKASLIDSVVTGKVKVS